MKKIISKTLSVAIAISMILMPARDAFSLPSGESVVNGSATFDRSEAGTLKVTTATDNVIIEYSTFDIGENEYVYFYMPSASANALNKVLGNDISYILGDLHANGRIYIINTNGIVIGPQSNIEVGSLMASTLSISNEDFLAGNYRFEKLSDKAAQILNQGNIIAAQGGFIALLSDSVRNEGSVIARQGTIALASGKKMTLSFDNDGLVQVAIDEATQTKIEGIEDAISNTGTIKADSGLVLVKTDTLKDLFKNAINNTGVVEAGSVVEGKDGAITLVAKENSIVTTGTLHAADEITVSAGADILLRGNVTSDLDSVSVTSDKANIDIDATVYAPKGNILFKAENGAIKTLGAMTADPDTGKIIFKTSGNIDVGGKYAASSVEFDPTDVNITTTYNGAGNTTFWATHDISVGADVTITGGSLYFYADSTDENGTYDNGDGKFNHASGAISASSIFIEGSESITASNLSVTDSSGNVRIGGGAHAAPNVYLTGNITTSASNSGYVYVYSDSSVSQVGNIGSSGHDFSSVKFYLDNDQSGAGSYSGTGDIYATNVYVEQSTALSLGGLDTNGNLYIGYNTTSIPSSVNAGSTISADKEIYIYTNGDLTVNNITSTSSNVHLYADADGNNAGSFTHSSGTISVSAYCYVDGSGTMTLRNIDKTGTSYGWIYIGSSRKPSSVTFSYITTASSSPTSDCVYIYSNGDISGGPVGSSSNPFYYVNYNLDCDNSGSANLSTSSYAYNTYVNQSTALTLNSFTAGKGGLYIGSATTPSSIQINGYISLYENSSYCNIYSKGDINFGSSGSMYHGGQQGIVSLNADSDSNNSGCINMPSSASISSSGAVSIIGAGDIVIGSVYGQNVYIGQSGKTDSVTVLGSITGYNNGSLYIYSKGDITGNNYFGNDSNPFQTINLYSDTDNSGSASLTSNATLYLYASSIYVEQSTDLSIGKIYLGKTGGTLYVGNTNKPTSVNINDTIYGNTSNINIYSSGDITVNAGITSYSSGFNVTLNANNGSGGSIYGDNSHTITNSTVSLVAGSGKDIGKAGGQELLLNATTLSSLSGNHPNIYITNSGSGSLTIADMTNSQTTNIDFNKALAINDVTVTGGTVNIGQNTTPTSISQTDGNLITCDTLNIKAQNDIGTSSDPVEVNIASINSNSTSGNVYVNIQGANGNTVTIDNVTQNNSYTLSTNKSVYIDNLTVNGSGNAVNISTTSGDINVGNLIGSGPVTLMTTGGSILPNGSVIRGSSANLSASGTIGTYSHPMPIDVGTCSINASGQSGFFSACLTGRGSVVANDAPGLITMNSNIIHIPRGMSEVLDSARSSMHQLEDKNAGFGAEKYIVNVVPMINIKDFSSPYINMQDYKLESPYSLGVSPYLQ